MPHYYPVVLPAGKSLAGDSLGFHAYSLRIDNLTNQWLLEETSLAWIPPYSLGVCLRLYGTGVGIILNQAPIGQPQLAPLTGEQAVGVYSDQLRTEVAGSPVRQYSLVQSVSDLTQGAQPALPPVAVDRLWADNQGNIHHLHSNGQDIVLVDNTNLSTSLYPVQDPHYQTMINNSIPNGALGGNLSGTISNGGVDIKPGSYLWLENTANLQLVRGAATGGGSMTFLRMDANDLIHISDVNALQFESYAGIPNVTFYDGGGIQIQRGSLVVGSPNSQVSPTFPLQVFVWDMGADVACAGGNVTLFTITLPQTGNWYVDCTLTFTSPTSGCLFDAYCGAPSTYGAGATATVPAANGAVNVHMTALVQGTNQFSASCWTSFAGTLRAKTTYYNYQATHVRAVRYG